jgi:hypothetical protein
MFNYKTDQNEFSTKITNRPGLGLFNDDEQLLEGGFANSGASEK